MLRPRVSPTILLAGSGCYKAKKFIKYKYLGDVINTIKVFNELSVDELTIYSPRTSQINFQLLKRISREANMPLCYGGGIKTSSEAKKLIEIGFEKISLCTNFDDEQLVKDIINNIGSQSVVFTFDYKYSILKKPIFYIESGDKKIKNNITDIASYCNRLGIGEVVFQNINLEGSRTGFDFDFISKYKKLFSMPFKVSSGCKDEQSMIEINKVYPTVNFAVSAFFVLQGKLDAVLISYNNPFNRFL